MSSQSRLFAINQWFLLIILLWAPLPKGSNTDWSAALLVFLVATSLFIWSIHLLRTKHSSFPIKSPAVILSGLLLLFQAWVAGQWLFETKYDPAQHFQYLMLGVAYNSMFILVLAHFRKRVDLTKLIAVLIISGTFQAFYGTSVVLGAMEPFLFEKVHYMTDATGTFVNRNHLAGYLVMVIGLGIGLMLAMRDGREWNWRNFMELVLSNKMKIRLSLVVMVIGLVMSHSRMGNTAFFIGLIIVGAMFIFSLKEHRVRNSLLLVSFIVIDIIIISQYFGLDKLKERLMNTEVTVTQQSGEVLVDINDLRGPIFEKSMHLFEQAPLTGLGAGGYEVAFMPLAGPNFGGVVDHVHNDYIEFLVEYGLIGVIPLALFVAIALSYAIRSLRNRQSYYRSGIGFGSAMAIIGILAHSFTDFNLHIPANALTFVVVCAIAVLSFTHESHSRKGVKKRRLSSE
ncbi:Polymerase [uncultured Thiomicrorhabdus sp.]